jgi:hypothetical protein
VQRFDTLLDRGPRAGETDDAFEAAEEGLTWIPPVDPPIRTGDLGQPEVAAGFGTTAHDEPFDLDHHAAGLPGEDEQSARVVEALRADASTAGLADRIAVDTDGARVILTGEVDDIEDEEAVLAVAETATGVGAVQNHITVSAVERTAGAEPARPEGDNA